MNCEIIKDLIPLYIDDCCSEESAALVKDHLEKCPQCNSLYESMKTPDGFATVAAPPKKLKFIDSWKASVLQSVLLFVSFAIITVGVALEAYTPTGDENGDWAFALVIPATGFMLSLANWYFVKFYKSKKIFSDCSLLTTLGITVGAYIWALFHYEINLIEIFSIFSETDFVEAFTTFSFFISAHIVLNWEGILLTAVFCVLSKLLSNKYATMLGKENVEISKRYKTVKSLLISISFIVCAYIILSILFFCF